MLVVGFAGDVVLSRRFERKKNKAFYGRKATVHTPLALFIHAPDVPVLMRVLATVGEPTGHRLCREKTVFQSSRFVEVLGSSAAAALNFEMLKMKNLAILIATYDL